MLSFADHYPSAEYAFKAAKVPGLTAIGNPLNPSTSTDMNLTLLLALYSTRSMPDL
jgi:hypothetical protein